MRTREQRWIVEWPSSAHGIRELHVCHIARYAAVAVSYFLPFLLLLVLLVLSFVVVLGLRLTVDCFTNRPVIALRPRLPPLDFDGTSAPFIACSHDAMTKLPSQPGINCPCPRLGPSAVTG